jgi:Ca-activated chloride channel family protein
MNIFKAIIAFIFLSTLSAAGIFAQDTDVIRVETDLVSVSVAVRDEKGRAVKGLSREQFEILDNKTKQTLAHFSAQDAAVSYGIVYDLHPTTDASTKAVLESLRQFTKELSPAEDFFITVFNERGNLTVDFVPSVEQVTQQLSARGPRSLYDAVLQAAEKLRARRNQKQTLIIISDGADHRSHHSYNELIKQMRGLNMQTYAVLLDENADGRWTYSDITRNREPRTIRSDATANDRAAISDLSLKTGGAAYVEGLENQQRLYSAYKQIAKEMNEQYTLGFYPSATDGRWHSLAVRLVPSTKESKKYVLTYRQGYQSPKAKN